MNITMIVRIDGLPQAQANQGSVSLAQYHTTMPVRCKLKIESLSKLLLGADFLYAGRALVFPDIAHELGLQTLGAELTADVQSAFTLGNLVIPGAKVEHWPVEFDERSPHQPPVVSEALERPAIGTGTTIH
jgi:hypothetical protein